jgi:hypothetical protein
MRVLLVAMIGAALAVGAWAQMGGGKMSIPDSGDVSPEMSGHRHRDPVEVQRAREMAKLRNEDRQKKLVADTERLLALATDLKAQVDQASGDKTGDKLSADRIKQVGEIEKLAHSVKERMKG